MVLIVAFAVAPSRADAYWQHYTPGGCPETAISGDCYEWIGESYGELHDGDIIDGGEFTKVQDVLAGAEDDAAGYPIPESSLGLTPEDEEWATHALADIEGEGSIALDGDGLGATITSGLLGPISATTLIPAVALRRGSAFLGYEIGTSIYDLFEEEGTEPEKGALYGTIGWQMKKKGKKSANTPRARVTKRKPTLNLSLWKLPTLKRVNRSSSSTHRTPGWS